MNGINDFRGIAFEVADMIILLREENFHRAKLIHPRELALQSVFEGGTPSLNVIARRNHEHQAERHCEEERRGNLPFVSEIKSLTES